MSLKALLVEDNAGDVRLIEMALAGTGAEVELRVAKDGVKALEYLRQHGKQADPERPDFILLDLNLPRKGGLEVLAEIKRDPALRLIPVIVLTSSTIAGDICQAYNRQASAYFAKPVNTYESLMLSIVKFMKTAELPTDCLTVVRPVPRQEAGEPAAPEKRAYGPSLPGWTPERTLQAMVESSMDPIIILMLDGTITTWNNAAERLYGYTAQEAIGRNIALTVTEERIGGLRNHLAAVARGDKVGYFETIRLDRNGRSLAMSMAASSVKDSRGEVVGLSVIARDVSDERLDEDRFRIAAEWSPSAIVMADASGKILLVNKETERLFGYDRKDLIGMSVDLLVPDRFRSDHPRHRAEFAAHPEARAMGAGRELYGLRKDGTEFPVEIGLRPVETQEGTAVLSAIVDITERKQAEERFRVAVESSPSAMIMVDEAGRILLVNQETERLFGYKREELIGSMVETLVPERFRVHHPYLRANFLAHPERRAMGAGRDLFGLRKDGTEVPIVIGLTPISTSTGTMVLSAIVDISERRQAEEQFRMAVESSPNAMVMIDESGLIVLINQETERLFGYARGELIGKPIEVLVPTRFRPSHPRQRAEFMAKPEKRVMGAGRDLYGVRKDGSEVPVEIGLTPIQTPRGVFVLSAIVDITERKRAENQLAQQTRELERSNQQLEQFAYAASHDLQEPLRMVASYTQLLSQKYGDRLDEEATTYLNYARDGALRMQGLILALLAYSRVGTHGGELKPISSDEALDLALANLRLSLEESAAQIVRAELPMVLGDMHQLAETFQNLVGNALKFRGSHASRITISAERAGEEWVFSVADNGIGIEPQYFDRIFEVFQRLHTRDEYPGTGIGLAICKRIVERFGGRIWVTSTLGEGTTFHFTMLDRGARAYAGRAGAGLAG